MQLLSGLNPNQVLQRDRRGRAVLVAEGTTLGRGPVDAVVTGLRGFTRPRRVGVSRKGGFRIRLIGLPVGGPYRIELRCGTDHLVVDEIRVGDVWLLAGQSNMQGYGDLDTGLRQAPGVFARSMGGAWSPAEEPLHVLEESADPVHTAAPLPPEKIRELRRRAKLGAGPALSFAAELFRRTGVPQGLIACAHGGTSLSELDPARANEGGRSLYGSLLRACQSTGQPIAGLLWYQGESDATDENHAFYTQRFVGFVQALRRDLRQPQLPVLTVQLGRTAGIGASQARSWNSVQEQQRLIPELLPNVGVVAAVDLPLSDNIHLSGAAQRRLGVRLAHLARRLVFGVRGQAPEPRILGVRRLPRRETDSTAAVRYEVKLAHVAGRLRGLCERTFTFVDARHDVLDAIIGAEQIAPDRVLLRAWPSLLRCGAKLMYGHGGNPALRLVDERDAALPVTGPMIIADEPIPGPGIVVWAGGHTVHPLSLESLDAEQVTALAAQEPSRKGGEGYWPEFINLHQRWVGHQGCACFTTQIVSTSTVRLLLGFGYDGPVRLWFDGRQIHSNPLGTNPCVADQYQLPVRVTPGRHRLDLALDVNGGKAWGFALRWLAPATRPGRRHQWPRVDDFPAEQAPAT